MIWRNVYRLCVFLFLVDAVLPLWRHGWRSLQWVPWLCMAIGLSLSWPRPTSETLLERLRQPRPIFATLCLLTAAGFFAHDLVKLAG
jgi:hypothetical protein